MPLDLVEGWTAPIRLACKINGSAASLNGKTVVLVLHRRDAVPVDTTGKLEVYGPPADGIVQYLPDGVDLLERFSPYRARVRATDGVGDDAYFPSAFADVWTVHKP